MSAVPTAGQEISNRSRLNAANLLSVYAALLILLPAALVVPGMGAAGRPAVAAGLGLLLWWLTIRLHPGLVTRGRQPVRWVLLFLTVAFLASYVAGLDRGLLPLEARSADRYLIVLGSWLGVALVAADGLLQRRDLERLTGCIVAFCAVSASIGILQFYNIDLAPYIRLPGLVYNQELVGVGQRGGPGFNRVYGTQQHYIEFGVVLALTLPLALHKALTAGRRVSARMYWLASATLAAALPLSISRAGVLGVIAGFLVLASVWRLGVQIKMFMAVVGGVLAFQVVNPGVLGTLRSGFLNAANDPSITARVDDYAATASYLRDRPWFGRGPGTYVPEIYRLLDNQFLASLLEVGVLGTTALVAVFAATFLLGRAVRRTPSDGHLGHFGQAVAASAVVAFIASLTFDSLFFPTFAGLLFLALGMAGASSRLAARTAKDSSTRAADIIRPVRRV